MDQRKIWNLYSSSAYKSLMEARQSEEARNNNGHAVSSSENDTDLWRRLWKLPVVPKVRVFWWRVLPRNSS
jgi:ribosomal protein L2